MSGEDLRKINWKGSLPVVLTLSPKSVSTPTLPAPIHALVHRQTYLHIALEDYIHKLYEFAPTLYFRSKIVQEEPGDEDDDEVDEIKDTSFASTERSEPRKPELPVCWFEDEVTQQPLRWHHFTGVLADLRSTRELPWRLILHFSNYPSSILPFESPRSFYKNSLKQALCIRHGTAKVALNLTKADHGTLWDAIQYQQYTNIAMDDSDPKLIPVRVLHKSNPPIQRRCPVDWTLRDLLEKWKVPGIAFVAGVVPDLSTPIWDLWKALAHPDQFLYVLVNDS